MNEVELKEDKTVTVNKVKMITAKSINASTGDSAMWLYFAVAIPAPEDIGFLASLMRASASDARLVSAPHLQSQLTW